MGTFIREPEGLVVELENKGFLQFATIIQENLTILKRQSHVE